jgi:hypothetical protein
MGAVKPTPLASQPVIIDARNRLLSTYVAACRESDESPILERYVLRHAVTLGSKSASHRLATRWSSETARPMLDFSVEAERYDRLGKSSASAAKFVLVHLGSAAGLVYAGVLLVLGLLNWTLNGPISFSFFGVFAFLVVAWMGGGIFRLSGAFWNAADKLEAMIAKKLGPAEDAFYLAAGGKPPQRWTLTAFLRVLSAVLFGIPAIALVAFFGPIFF